jgi:serine/threonine protein kinase
MKFAHYSLTRQIGKNPLSTTYLATPLSQPEREVVIKIFPVSCLGPGYEARDFLRDATRLQQLTHPHLLPVLAADIEQDQPFIVSPYLFRGSLRAQRPTLFSPRHFSLARILQLGIEMGLALSYCHEHTVLHGHLSPDNVLFDNDGNAQLSDFGLASLLDESVSSHDGVPSRTTGYHAPEQHMGLVSQKSDQFSLGCLLYELLTGTLPDPSSAPFESLDKPPRAPSQLVPHLPKMLDAILLKALARKPSARYESMVQLVEALQAIPVPAENSTPGFENEALSAPDSASALLTTQEKTPIFPFAREASINYRNLLSSLQPEESEALRQRDELLFDPTKQVEEDEAATTAEQWTWQERDETEEFSAPMFPVSQVETEPIEEQEPSPSIPPEEQNTQPFGSPEPEPSPSIPLEEQNTPPFGSPEQEPSPSIPLEEQNTWPFGSPEQELSLSVPSEEQNTQPVGSPEQELSPSVPSEEQNARPVGLPEQELSPSIPPEEQNTQPFGSPVQEPSPFDAPGEPDTRPFGSREQGKLESVAQQAFQAMKVPAEPELVSVGARNSTLNMQDPHTRSSSRPKLPLLLPLALALLLAAVGFFSFQPLVPGEKQALLATPQITKQQTPPPGAQTATPQPVKSATPSPTLQPQPTKQPGVTATPQPTPPPAIAATTNPLLIPTPTSAPTAAPPTPTPTPAPTGKTVWFKSAAVDLYVSARFTTTNSPLDATASAVSTWESFLVVDAGNGTIALQDTVHDNYVSAWTAETNTPLEARSTQIQTAETFRWIKLSSNTIALQAVINGKYVAASSSTDSSADKHSPLQAQSNQIQTAETFLWGQV